MKDKVWRTNATSKLNNLHCDIYLGYFGHNHFEDTQVINDNIPRLIECGFLDVPFIKSEEVSPDFKQIKSTAKLQVMIPGLVIIGEFNQSRGTVSS